MVTSSTTPSKVTLDLEHLRARCKQLQDELDGVRRTLSTEREESHINMLKLEARLNASKKTNMELEVYLYNMCMYIQGLLEPM